MKRNYMISAMLILLLLTVSAQAAEKNYMPDVKIHHLDNGLTLMVVERHDSPTVACYRYQKVGSVNERPGITGAAHLLEHMMFKGTRKLGTWNYAAEMPIMQKIEKLMDQIDAERAKDLSGYTKSDKSKIDRLWAEIKRLQTEQRKYIRKNEVFYIYDREGGDGLNASTGFDQTDYYVNLPANKLEVWAYMESDRLSNPVFREFYSERDVVHEEKRMHDNTPGGRLFEALINTMFTTMPFGHEIVGWTSDLESMRSYDVMNFFKRYYAPNNTTLVLVGDVKDKDAYALVKKYFGNIPRQPEPRPLFSQEPPQSGERRTEVEFDASPTILIGYHIPKLGNPDNYPLEILSNILSSGRTCRFHKNIIKKDLALSCDSSAWILGYTGIFLVSAETKEPVSSADLEKAIYEQIDRLKTEPVSEWELEKAKNKVDSSFIDNLKDKMDVAQQLAWYNVWAGDWKKFDNRKELKSVTAEDIMRVAKKYLVKSNRTVVTLVPLKKVDEASGKITETQGVK